MLHPRQQKDMAGHHAPHLTSVEAAARPAGPGRASSRRAERSSRRGRLAGGQAARRPEICRGNKQRRKTAAHEHTKQPGPPDSTRDARNTRGAATPHSSPSAQHTA